MGTVEGKNELRKAIRKIAKAKYKSIKKQTKTMPHSKEGEGKARIRAIMRHSKVGKKDRVHRGGSASVKRPLKAATAKAASDKKHRLVRKSPSKRFSHGKYEFAVGNEAAKRKEMKQAKLFRLAAAKKQKRNRAAATLQAKIKAGEKKNT